MAACGFFTSIIVGCVLPLGGFVILTNMYLQNIRRVVPAVLVAMLRQGLAFIPILYIFNWLFGLDGVLIAQPVSDIISFSVALPLCIFALNHNPTKSGRS